MSDKITGYRQLTSGEINLINAVKDMCSGLHRTMGEMHNANHEARSELYKELERKGAIWVNTNGMPRFASPAGATEEQRTIIGALDSEAQLIDPSEFAISQARARLLEVEMWLVRAIAKPRT